MIPATVNLDHGHTLTVWPDGSMRLNYYSGVIYDFNIHSLTGNTVQVTKPLARDDLPPVTRRDMFDQVVHHIGDTTDQYDTDGIVHELVREYGVVDLDTIELTKRLRIIGRHKMITR